MQTRTSFFAASGSAVRQILLGALLAAPIETALAAPPPAEHIVVVSSQGDVRVTMDGETHAVKTGTVIKPPATIRTGRDGAIELRQGRTRASIAADTQVEIPTLGVRGKFVERIIQPRGNVFYDVGPRMGKKLRVETPYLVAVIKGTQFNVAAHDEGATVSLFEGRLEIWTPDDSDVVQLNAGEIATRGRGDRGIRVLLMATGETLRASNASPIGGSSARSSSVFDPIGQGVTSGDLVTGIDSTGVRLSPVEGAAGDLIDTSSRPITAELSDSKIDLGSTSPTADAVVAVDLGVATLDANVGAAVDLGAGSVEMAAALDTNLAGIIDVGASADAAIDLGSGTIDAGVTGGVDLSGATLVDTSLAAGIDASSGTIDLGTEAIVADTPLAIDAGVDLGSPAIDADLTVGTLEVDLGVDLGTDATAPATEPTVIEEVIAPLRGLLGR